MQTFVMLTRLSPGALNRDPVALEAEVVGRIEAECPGVTWISSYVLLGPADYLDVFLAPDIETAMKVSLIIRTLANATTETWPATDWEDFKKIAAGG